MQTIEFDIPPDLWLTANGRLHWAQKAARTSKLRTLAAYTARQANLQPMHGVTHVMAYIQYPSAGRADPNNAAPTTKALVDGLTDAGVWTDDDSAHLLGPDHRRLAGKASDRLHKIVFTLKLEPQDR